VPPGGFSLAEAVDPTGGQRAAGIVFVLPGYFETLDISLVRGRLLTWEDLRSGADVAVVAESTARALFPDCEALGGTFRNRQGRQFTVVGVVADVRRSLTQTMDPPAYVIPPDDTTRGLTIIARMRSRQSGTLDEIRREIGALAPDTPVTGVWWSDSINALAAYRNPRFQTLVLGTFAALGLGLTALGIFAIVRFLVVSRTREMGVRLALGASPRSLVRSVMREALTPVAAGILIGVLATHWIRRIVETQLFQINAQEPLTLAAAALTVAVAALMAAYLPARHASRVDPSVVLRVE
jgi:putative ABC transport system permease protein